MKNRKSLNKEMTQTVHTARILCLTLSIAFFSVVGASAETLLKLKPLDGPATSLSREQLEALQIHEVETTTEWTDGVARFEGPSMRDVLAIAGLEAVERIRAVAANDYAVEIPVSELLTYDVVLAMRMNGTPLSLRDKGPLWIVFPRDAHDALEDPVYNAYWVWQLIRIEAL